MAGIDSSFTPSFGMGTNPSSASLSSASDPSPKIYRCRSAPDLFMHGSTMSGVPTCWFLSSGTARTTSSNYSSVTARSTTALDTISTADEVSSSGETKMSKDEEFKFTLKAMVYEGQSKALVVANNHFADMLLSFLTLPLGRIMRVLQKHYGDKTPTIGSLTTLYRSLADLDALHFLTEGAKLTLLHPKSSFELEHEQLKLNVYDSKPAEYFYCTRHDFSSPSVSVYYDSCHACVRTGHLYRSCKMTMIKETAGEGSSAISSGVFTVRKEVFVISDDLHILPNDMGLLEITSMLGFADIEKFESRNVTIGFKEMVSLLRASLTSQTPLLDVILGKKGQMNSVMLGTETETLLGQLLNEEHPRSKKMILKLMIQKSTSKLLYAQAQEDFVEFLFSLLHIPLGGVEHLLAGRTYNKALNNLYRSTSEFMDDKKFITPWMKKRLMIPSLPHGCVSKHHIFSLTEKTLPSDYDDLSRFSSVNFPRGEGRYLEGPQTYKVMDNLSISPFCILSTIISLNEQKIPLSDIKEMQVQIGLKEALQILRASLASTTRDVKKARNRWVGPKPVG